MRRFGRRTPRPLTFLSLLLSVATAALWVRSRHVADRLDSDRVDNRGRVVESYSVDVLPGYIQVSATYLPLALPFADTSAFRYRSRPAPLWLRRSSRWSVWPAWESRESFIQVDASKNRPIFEGRDDPDGRVAMTATSACSIPLSWGVALGLMLPTLRVLAWWRQLPRVQPGVCRSCSYDLTGNVSGVCPECGTPLTNAA